MRLTKQNFELFKEYCLAWRTKLGLVNWAIYFYQENLEGAYATTAWDTGGTVATIKLTTTWDTGRQFNNDELNSLALHEVLHILLAPLVAEAEERYSTQSSINSAEHAIIRTLQHAVYEAHNA